MRRIALFALLAALACPAALAAADAPRDPEDLLARVSAAYAATPALSARCAITSRLESADTTDEGSMDLAVDAAGPERVALALTLGGQTLKAARADGDCTGWFSVTGAYARWPSRGSLDADLRRPPLTQVLGDLWPIAVGVLDGLTLAELQPAGPGGDVSVQPAGRGRANHTLSLVTKDREVEVQFAPDSMRVVQASVRLLDQNRASRQHDERSAVDITYLLSCTYLDEAAPVDALEAPEGARVVSSLQQTFSPAPIDRMPDFELEGLVEGETWSDERLAGKVVALDFWATWCGPCRMEMPELAEIYADLKDRGFVLLAVNMGEPRQQAAAWLEAAGLDVPVALDIRRDLAGKFGVRGIPALFIFDRAGKLRENHTGYRPGLEDEVRSLVEELLAEPAPAEARSQE